MRPHPPKPPLASPYRCRACALVDNQLAKVGSARLDGSDFRVSFQVVCNSCGASSARCDDPAKARESWKLMAEGSTGEATGTPQPIANPVVPDGEESGEEWLGGSRPKIE